MNTNRAQRRGPRGPQTRAWRAMAVALATSGLLGLACLDEENGATGSGASGQPAQIDPLVRARVALEQRGVRSSGGLERRGDDLALRYETSTADDFDDQLLLVWGTAFGTLAPYAGRTVSIINTVAGRPTVQVQAEVKAIEAFVAGRLDTPAFFASLRLQALGQAASEKPEMPPPMAGSAGTSPEGAPAPTARRAPSEPPTREARPTRPANRPQPRARHPARPRSPQPRPRPREP